MFIDACPRAWLLAPRVLEAGVADEPRDSAIAKVLSLHLRTSNVVESPFAAIRLRTDAAKRYKKVANATVAIWKLLMVAEKGFRRLQGYELMAKVAEGVEFKDGIEVVKVSRSYAA